MAVIESPRAGFVSTINVETKAHVLLGQVVGTIDDSEERLRLQQLAIMSRTLILAEERLSSQFNLIKSVADLRVEAAEANQLYRSKLLDYRKQEAQVGSVDAPDVIVAQVAELAANYEKRRTASDTARLFETTADLRASLERFQKLIDAERSSIERRIERLTLTASTNGVITWFVFEHGYVDAGTILATISTE